MEFSVYRPPYISPIKNQRFGDPSKTQKINKSSNFEPAITFLIIRESFKGLEYIFFFCMHSTVLGLTSSSIL